MSSDTPIFANCLPSDSDADLTALLNGIFATTGDERAITAIHCGYSGAANSNASPDTPLSGNSLASVFSALDDNPSATLVVFYEALENCLEQCIANGQSIQDTTQQWLSVHTTLYTLMQRYHGRCYLFSRTDVLRSPELFVRHCHEQLLLDSDVNPVSAAITQNTAPDSLTRLLALQACNHSADTRTLNLRLQAMSYPCRDFDSDAVDIVDAVSVLSCLQQTTASLDAGLSENNAALAELQSVHSALQDEYQQLTANSDRLVRELARLDTSLLAEKEQRIDAQQSFNQLQQQSGVQLHTIETLQAELAKLQSENQHSIEQLQQARDAHNAHQSEQAAELSRSNARLQSLTSENEILASQLRLLTREFELYCLNRGDMPKPEQPTEQTFHVIAAPEIVDTAAPHSDQHDAASCGSESASLSWLSRREQRKAKLKALHQEQQQIELIRQSGLFDEQWYQTQYSDVAQSGVDPIKHYLRYGAGEQRNPSSQFNTAYYLGIHPDLSNSKLNPLIHYIRFGKQEGRAIKPAALRH